LRVASPSSLGIFLSISAAHILILVLHKHVVLYTVAVLLINITLNLHWGFFKGKADSQGGIFSPLTQR
jgi:hypothetical protein